ncbi:MAG TPA: MBL fold metallo-hydrolase [Acidimicrobiia bacterium]|nr:MBL fold metallo-hydrolase [Acidimicrobiia bacterium]
MELSPSLHRIGSDLVNVYLVADDTGVTVVDAGLPGQWDELEQELASMGRTMADVRAVVLTHGDTDHIGFAERIRGEHGVPILVHELDAPRARGEVKKEMKWGRVKVGPLMKFLWYSGIRGGLSITPVADVGTFVDGQVLDLPGSPVVVHIPGHTPGSVAFHVPSVDAVFVGDAMTTGHVLTGAAGPQLAPFTLDPEQALASMTLLEGLGASWVLPGHGAPWEGGIAEAVRLIREAA